MNITLLLSVLAFFTPFTQAATTASCTDSSTFQWSHYVQNGDEVILDCRFLKFLADSGRANEVVSEECNTYISSARAYVRDVCPMSCVPSCQSSNDNSICTDNSSFRFTVNSRTLRCADIFSAQTRNMYCSVRTPNGDMVGAKCASSCRTCSGFCYDVQPSGYQCQRCNYIQNARGCCNCGGGCYDSILNWSDVNGRGCAWYEENYGPNVVESKCSKANMWAKNNISAKDVCCVCGAGARLPSSSSNGKFVDEVI